MLISLRPLPAAGVPFSVLLLLVSFGCSGRERSLGEALGLGRGGRFGSDTNGTSVGGATHGGTPATSGAGTGSNDDGTSTGGAGAQATTSGMNGEGGGAGGDPGSDTGGTSPSHGGASGADNGGSSNGTGGVATTGGIAALGGASGANSGGTSAGGRAASGGSLATGGANSSGGKAASGGASSTGGKAGGGALNATGGAQATGGSETIGGCDRQLLANADFDQGPTATWVETSTWPGVHIVTHRNDTKLAAEAVTPYSGDYLAWLGGIPDNLYDHHTVILTQKVAIPADAATLTLSGRRWVKTVEDASEVFDEAYLEFEGVDESVAWQALWLTNRDATSGWVAFEASTDGLDAVRGKTITFVAYSRTDPAGKTSFFLDSLRLIASCGR